MEPIRFFDRSSPCFEFSNYYLCTFILDDKVWYSVESYYQSQKFNTPDTQDYYRLISKADSPQKAKNMGNLKPNFRGDSWLICKLQPELGRMNVCIMEQRSKVKIRGDWEEVKISVMKRGLYAKFTQNPPLKEVLMSTVGREIIENSPFDSFWGSGGDDKGQNHLGKLLVRLRDHLDK